MEPACFSRESLGVKRLRLRAARGTFPVRQCEAQQVPKPSFSRSENSGVSRQTDKTPQIIAIANQKGGVGKTTTAINLAAALVENGSTVLLVDLDPQGNASTGLGVEPDQRTFTTYDLLFDEADLDQVVAPTSTKGLWITPATADLSSADLQMVSSEHRSTLLRTALRRPSMDRFGFDYVLIDCPPSLSLLTVNAMIAAELGARPVAERVFRARGIVPASDHGAPSPADGQSRSPDRGCTPDHVRRTQQSLPTGRTRCAR